MRINFECSEAQYAPHEKPAAGLCRVCGHFGDDCTEEPPVSIEQPSHVTLDVPGSWVQFTYGILRIPEHGDEIAYFTEGFWVIDGDHPVTSAFMLDGSEADAHVTRTGGMKFTDIIID